MAIIFDESKKIFTLVTKNSSYQMIVGEYGFLLHLYYGEKIVDTDLSYLLQFADRGFSGNPYETHRDKSFSLDCLMQEYSVLGNGDYRTSCLQIINADGSNAVDLRYKSHKIYNGKYSLNGLPAIYATEGEAQTLEIVLEDECTEVEITLLYGVLPEYDMITRAAILRNGGKEKIVLDKALSVCLDFKDSEYDLLTFYGKHAMERELERTSLRHGKFQIESTRGTSSHQQNPFVILCDRDATETSGNVYGVSFLYSGNFIASAEVDQIGQTRLTMGIHPDCFSYELEKGETFIIPETVLSFSKEGMGKLSSNYHKSFRKHLCRGIYKEKRRPILINNWEATYMEFDSCKLLEIAKGAAELGIEMLVMDDGWFGKRDTDTSGLGDWVVNTEKLKGTLKELADGVRSLGMKFGIWFEPEAVSEDSDLFRNHPDWCFRIPERNPIRSRYQLVLDFSRKEVVDYIFCSMCEILDSADISYVKWDMNRSLSDVWSLVLPAHRQGEVSHKYVLGLYDLLERLVCKYPELLIEGCSGGGGRFDGGMLYYTPQIWCSDNTDAIERIKIQYGTSFGYPISAVGSHVSACPNHQTGRVAPLETRGVVAMAGTFGYELDINKMTAEEKQIVKTQIEEFKKNYETITLGEYYRLTDPYKNQKFAAWEYVSTDRAKALLNVVLLQARANSEFNYVKLQGLNPDMKYKVDVEGMDGITVTGAALMNAGIPIPNKMGDYQAYQIGIEQV